MIRFQVHKHKTEAAVFLRIFHPVALLVSETARTFHHPHALQGQKIA